MRPIYETLYCRKAVMYWVIKLCPPKRSFDETPGMHPVMAAVVHKAAGIWWF